MKIDYRELLQKYIRYVGDVEGGNYIDDGYRGYRDDQQFTPEEWRELRRLARVNEPPTTAG